MGNGVGQKAPALEQLKSKCKEKPLHGHYPKRTKEKDVDQDKTHNWPSTPGLKSETEGFTTIIHYPKKWH